MDIFDVKAPTVAASISRNANTVRRWAAGETEPAAEDILALADYFGIKPSDLLDPPAIPPYELDGALFRAAQAGLRSGRRRVQARAARRTPPTPLRPLDGETVE